MSLLKLKTEIRKIPSASKQPQTPATVEDDHSRGKNSKRSKAGASEPPPSKEIAPPKESARKIKIKEHETSDTVKKAI